MSKLTSVKFSMPRREKGLGMEPAMWSHSPPGRDLSLSQYLLLCYTLPCPPPCFPFPCTAWSSSLPALAQVSFGSGTSRQGQAFLPVLLSARLSQHAVYGMFTTALTDTAIAAVVQHQVGILPTSFNIYVYAPIVCFEVFYTQVQAFRAILCLSIIVSV